MSAFDPKRTLRWAKHPRFRTIAPFGDFARTVKHMRFPTQTRESPHFRVSTRAIVKTFLVGAHGRSHFNLMDAVKLMHALEAAWSHALPGHEAVERDAVLRELWRA